MVVGTMHSKWLMVGSASKINFDLSFNSTGKVDPEPANVKHRPPHMPEPIPQTATNAFAFNYSKRENHSLDLASVIITTWNIIICRCVLFKYRLENGNTIDAEPIASDANRPAKQNKLCRP